MKTTVYLSVSQQIGLSEYIDIEFYAFQTTAGSRSGSFYVTNVHRLVPVERNSSKLIVRCIVCHDYNANSGDTTIRLYGVPSTVRNASVWLFDR